MSNFKLIKKTSLSEMNLGDILPESDFTATTKDGDFLQFEFIDEDHKRDAYHVSPGIWSIQKNMNGYFLESTSFTNDKILEDFVNTKEVEEIVDCFFNNLHLYKEFGIEVPKRNVLLYGPAGTGKSTALSKCVRRYVSDNKTAIVIWETAKFEALEVKSFIKSFEYVNGVEKIILVAEDLGGLENEGVRIRSDSSLLSLLDNNEKTFCIPVMVIATTNHPENFAANLTNRPGRFDDKIEVGYPNSDARVALLKFFSKDQADAESLNFIASNKCEKFSPAVIRESYIRSRLHSQPLIKTLEKMINEAKKYEKAFTESRNLGF